MIQKNDNLFGVLGLGKTYQKEEIGEETIQLNEKVEKLYNQKKQMINQLREKNRNSNRSESQYQKEEAYLSQLEEQVEEAYQQLRTKEGRIAYSKQLEEAEKQNNIEKVERPKKAETRIEPKVENKVEKPTQTKNISAINPNDQGITEIGYIKKLRETQRTVQPELEYIPITKGKKGTMKKQELQFTPIHKGKMGEVAPQRKTKKKPEQRQAGGEER